MLRDSRSLPALVNPQGIVRSGTCLGVIGADVIDRELPVGQAETAFGDDGRLLDPEQRAALAALIGVLAAQAGIEQAQAA